MRGIVGRWGRGGRDCKDGALVGELAFHHCNPGAICELSLLFLLLVLAPRGRGGGGSRGSPVFHSLQKPRSPNCNWTRIEYLHEHQLLGDLLIAIVLCDDLVFVLLVVLFLHIFYCTHFDFLPVNT